jgi:hypothetical protein
MLVLVDQLRARPSSSADLSEVESAYLARKLSEVTAEPLFQRIGTAVRFHKREPIPHRAVADPRGSSAYSFSRNHVDVGMAVRRRSESAWGAGSRWNGARLFGPVSEVVQPQSPSDVGTHDEVSWTRRRFEGRR